MTANTTLTAILLMILSMASFAFADAMLKLLGGYIRAHQILVGLGGGGALIFALICLGRGQPPFNRAFLHPVVLLRNGIEAVAAGCMVTAFTLAPLSLVASIMQATPLIVTAGAALILRERVGPWRWGGVAVGFLGVLLMIRPEAGGGLGVFLAVIGAFGMAARDLTTRRMPPMASNLQLSVWGFSALILPGVVIGTVDPDWRMMEPVSWLLLSLLIAGACVAYFTSTTAMRMAEASLVAPFRYTRLPFALAFGFFIFDETLDTLTWLGILLVVGSGVFIALRERRKRG